MLSKTVIVTNKSVLFNKTLVWGTIILLSFIQLLFAFYRYPLAGSDAIAFLPAAINFANGDGLTNNVYHITRFLNGENQPPYFINYPPIFPLLFGYLLKITHNIYLNFALLHILLIVVFFWLIEKQFKITNSLSKTILLVFVLLAWSTQLNPGIGRPETLAELFLLGLLITFYRASGDLKFILSGILVTLTGFTHPIAGVYAACILLILISIQGFSAKDIIRLAAGSIFSLILLIIVYPYDFVELMNGIFKHASMVSSRSEFTFSKFLHYHFTYPEISFYFLIFLLFSCLIILNYREIFLTAKFRFLFLVTSILLVISVLYFTFQTIETSYNLYVLLPLMSVFILSRIHLSTPRSLIIVSCLIFMTSSAGFIRRVILFPIHLQEGVSYQQASKTIKNLDLKGKKIFVSTSLFPLFDSMRNLTDDVNDTTVQYLILQENYTGGKSPSTFNGFKKTPSSFSRKPVCIGTVRIASSIPGYQFMVYKRVF